MGQARPHSLAAACRLLAVRSGLLTGAGLLLLACVAGAGCKRADSDAAEGKVKSEAEFSRAHPPVVCLERLGRLVEESPNARPWRELPAEKALALCRGATSTAPVDCLLASHDLLVRSRQEVPALARLEAPLETAARLCAPSAGNASSGSATAATCFVSKVREGNEPAAALGACRPRARAAAPAPSPACVSRFGAGKDALRAKGKSYSAAQIDALCTGVSVPARPFACVEAFEGGPSEAFVACRGNDDPGAPGCFREARRLVVPFVTGKPGTTLSDALSARLCGRPE